MLAGHGRHNVRSEPERVEVHASPQDTGPALESFASQQDQQQQQQQQQQGGGAANEVSDQTRRLPRRRADRILKQPQC